MKKIILFICTIFVLTGCEQVDNLNTKVTLTDENNYTFIESNDNNVTQETNLEVVDIYKDFTQLDVDFEKAIGYEINLKNDNEKVVLSSKVKVGLLIPDEFSSENLIVYYVEDNKIIEQFYVQVEEVENIRYAIFETSHFSTYVLVQLKEKLQINEEQQTIKVEEKENESTNSSDNNSNQLSSNETNTSTNTNNSTSNSNQTNTTVQNNNTTQSSITINLIGMWQNDLGRYYQFNSDGTGTEAVNLDGWSNIEFTWAYQNGNLLINQGGYTYDNDITIYNNDKFANANTVFTRYYGEWPSNKDENGNITEGKRIVFEFINTPKGLKVTKQAVSSVYIEVTGPADSVRNGNFRGVIDLTGAVEGNNSVSINYIFPEDVTYQTYTTGNLVTLEKE